MTIIWKYTENTMCQTNLIIYPKIVPRLYILMLPHFPDTFSVHFRTCIPLNSINFLLSFLRNRRII